MGDSTQVDILNLAAVLERLGGDNELLEEVATLFLQSAPGLLARIREAIARRDAAALERSSHALKGSAANFGAAAAFRVALRLEEMGRSGDLRGAEEAYAALEVEMQRLQTALEALDENRPTSADC